MREKLLFTFVFFLALSLPQCGIISGNKESQDKEIPAPSGVDLSTPEKTIALFFKALIDGNDKLFHEVLGPDAMIPEFNPLQKIDEANPRIAGAEIIRSHVIKESKVYPDGFTVKPSDIEVYVTMKYDPIFFKDGTMPDGHVAFLLRKIDNKWKIISMIPFWPEEEKPN